MANESVGSAYLSVRFKTDDKAANGLEKTLEKAGESGGRKGGQKGGEQLGKGLESAVGTKAIVLGNLISDAITKAADKASAALGDMMQAAFDGFARYEQMAGGAEILFGDSAGQVMANAQKAFETAGMSANDYLQTVNGFSAGLIRSLGGDTVEAPRVADMAIRDMSDNVNTFGLTWCNAPIWASCAATIRCLTTCRWASQVLKRACSSFLTPPSRLAAFTTI